MTEFGEFWPQIEDDDWNRLEERGGDLVTNARAQAADCDPRDAARIFANIEYLTCRGVAIG